MRDLRPAWGGILGPALFVGAWLLAGALEPGYSPVHDAISRLAAVDASTRVLMTTGLVAFTLGALLYAIGLRASVPGPAWMAMVGTGLATVGVIAFPLGLSSAKDDMHGAFAILAYATLVATPLLAARPLAASGHRGAARLSVVTGVASGLCLAGTVAGITPGLMQRAGLTLADAWIAASAAWMLRRNR